MNAQHRADQPPRAIALPHPATGAGSLQKMTLLALLSIPVLAAAASFGKAQDMSWLGGNWYGVVAVFGVPAALGVFCWVAVHNMLGARARQDRARQNARQLPGMRTARRPF
jgi:hypothetical protein